MRGGEPGVDSVGDGTYTPSSSSSRVRTGEAVESDVESRTHPGGSMEGNVIGKRIQEDIKAAMKAGERLRLDTLRMLLSELKGVQIDEGELSEQREIAILGSSARKRRESISEYEKAGRDDLAEQERAELEIVMLYLPEQMDEAAIEAEVKKIIAETGAAGLGDMGKVMGAIMSRHKGTVDGNVVKTIAVRLLRGGN